MSSPTPPLAVELRPSRLAAAGLAGLAIVALPAAAASALPPALKTALLLLVVALLLQAWRTELRRGCRALQLAEDADGQVEVVARFADGRTLRAAGAGHARLGDLAVFVFLARTGRWRWLGPRRIAVVRDATDADGFRRLRARLG